ncbi:MAG: L,D-transpeptidase [Propionibacteriaceae bacterium]|nr:L,D-transpeptidase [Propionibacteriaceae bacterium]
MTPSEEEPLPEGAVTPGEVLPSLDNSPSGNNTSAVEVEPQEVEPQAQAEPQGYQPPAPQTLSGVYVTGGTRIGHGWAASRTIFPGDWNRDHSSDMMLVTESGALLFYRALMWDRFTPPVQIGQNWGTALEILGGADWDGDGNVDLVGRFRDGSLHFFRGDGRGGFAGQRQIGRNWNNFLEIAVINMGPNGRPALVGLRNDGNSFVYTSNTRVEFSDAIHSAIDWSGFRNLIGTGDWDNNGRGDLLVIDSGNTLRYLAADSSGRHFSHYMVGKGWGAMAKIQSARIHGRSYVIALSHDGNLYAYDLVNRERFVDPTPRVDSRCLTGRVMCASKSDRILHWVINGQIRASFDARFGAAATPSDDGAFRVKWKSRYHTSSIYRAYMPWAMFYNGGEAVHYSPGFATDGWHGGSGGCVNLRDPEGIDWLYNQVRIGDKVVVYV